MNVRQAKEIPLEDFLMNTGHQPIREKGGNVWYLSPLREESTPSFKVNRTLNSWYDFGIGKGGNIIKFISLLLKTENISEVLKYLKTKGSTVNTSRIEYQDHFSFPKQECVKRKIHISAISNDLLIKYLKERGISEYYLSNLQEATIIQGDKHYLSLAFFNDKGGYELNKKYYKGCTSKALSTIHKRYDRPIFVFEGFMDCLSFFELCKKDSLAAFSFIREANFLVLNSVSLIEEGKLALKPYSEIRLFLDNDAAGASASQEIKRVIKRVEDCSWIYKGYKDLNEFLIKADDLSFEGFLSRCAIVRTEIEVSSHKGNLAFTPEGRKSADAIEESSIYKRCK